MTNHNATRPARITPCFEAFASVARLVRETAERTGDPAAEVAAYSVLWFAGTGRAFTGFQRACAHMTRGTAKAYLRRVTQAMTRAAERRGATVPVTEDLTNQILAECMGLDPDERAVTATCGHPFGVAFRLERFAS